MNAEMWTTVGILITNLAAILSSYIKTRADNIASRKKSENNHTYLLEKIEGLERSVKKSEATREGIQNIYLALSEEAFSIMSANADITAPFQVVLNYIHIRIRNFASAYSLSPYRKNKQLIENYLPIEFATITGNIRHVINDNFSGIKEIEIKHTKKKYRCYKFITMDNPEIETNTRVLIATLTQNGLDEEQYITLFRKYIHSYFLNIIKGLRKWERL